MYIAFLLPCLISTYTRNRKLCFFYAFAYCLYGLVHKHRLIKDATDERLVNLEGAINTIMLFSLLNGVLNGVFILLKIRHPLIAGRISLAPLKRIFRRKK